jgi:hypothetical protein
MLRDETSSCVIVKFHVIWKREFVLKDSAIACDIASMFCVSVLKGKICVCFKLRRCNFFISSNILPR